MQLTSKSLTIVILFVTCCQIHGRTCVQNQPNGINGENLNVCAEYDINDRSLLVWFNLNRALNSTFDQFRFVLRSRDRAIAHGEYLQNITEFDRFDLENSVRLENLDAGIYEICVEFRQNLSDFIYEPRDGCVAIQIGEVSHRTFDQSSVPILVILAAAILIFFLLGLTVPPLKKKHDQRRAATGFAPSHRARGFVRALFQRHVEDEGRTTSLRQWARVRVLRHMHSLDPDTFLFRTVLDRYNEDSVRVPVGPVFTIDMEKSKGKHKQNYEEYQMKELH